MIYDVDGQITTNYDFDVIGECSLDAEDYSVTKFILERKAEGVSEVLEISDYVEPTESEDIFVPLQGEELMDYLVYYADRFKRETGKSFTRSLNAKINLTKK